MNTKCFLDSLLAVSHDINAQCINKIVIITNYCLMQILQATDFKTASYMLENSLYRNVYIRTSSSHVMSLVVPNLHRNE
jgi:hypothetical protein